MASPLGRGARHVAPRRLTLVPRSLLTTLVFPRLTMLVWRVKTDTRPFSKLVHIGSFRLRGRRERERSSSAHDKSVFHCVKNATTMRHVPPTSAYSSPRHARLANTSVRQRISARPIRSGTTRQPSRFAVRSHAHQRHQRHQHHQHHQHHRDPLPRTSRAHMHTVSHPPILPPAKATRASPAHSISISVFSFSSAWMRLSRSPFVLVNAPSSAKRSLSMAPRR